MLRTAVAFGFVPGSGSRRVFAPPSLVKGSRVSKPEWSITVRYLTSATLLMIVSLPALASGGFNVPEPGMLALMGTAAAALAMFRPRKK